MKKMKALYQILLALILLSFISGCSICKPEVKYIYLKQKCPKLQTVDINKTELEPIKLDVRVKNE